MSSLRLLLGLLLVAPATEAVAQRHGHPSVMRQERMMRPWPRRDAFPPRRGGEAMAAREMRREGRMLAAREIERRVVPTMPRAQYLGFDFDGAAVYTLKFLRDGTVIWVDVDARTGAVLGRTGR